MNLLSAPVQSDAHEWAGIRTGRFTASVIGKLFTEPRTLTLRHVREYCYLLPETPVSARTFKTELREKINEAGIVLFGDTAISLITSKAAERLGQRPAPQTNTRSMDRGSLLEHAARILLSRYWQPIEGTTFQPYGDNSGGTPDGLLGKGSKSWNVKCPEDPGDLALFKDSVDDGDFDALEDWNKVFAWQVMMEAKASGCKQGCLTLFTDRLPLQKITEQELQEVQDVMDAVAYQMGEVLGRPFYYRYESDGFAHVSRTFDLTDERSERIDRVLAAAETECQRFMALMTT